MITSQKSYAWPRFNIYRIGSTGYAYNPCSHMWEVYALRADGEIEDLLSDWPTRELALHVATKYARVEGVAS